MKPIDELPKLSPASPPHQELNESSNPVFPSADLDNDYIEPESPTGIDALLYDDDDDFNNTSIHSRSSTVQPQQQPSHSESSGDNNESFPPASQPVRDDYNPLVASQFKTDAPRT